jgi:ketosteroid isomerase-like protein
MPLPLQGGEAKMDTAEIARHFTELCAKGEFEAAEQYWADDVVSLEPFPSPMANLQGREAIKQKHQW